SQATLARFRDGLSHGNPFEIICPGTGLGHAPGRGGGITRRREAGPRAAARPDHPPASAWIDRGRAWITCRRAWITSRAWITCRRGAGSRTVEARAATGARARPQPVRAMRRRHAGPTCRAVAMLTYRRCE